MLTSPDNLWSPDEGTEYKPAIDQGASMQSVQDALSSLRASSVTPGAVSFSPTWINLTPGSTGGSISAKYQLIRGRCVGEIDVVLGSGFALNTGAVAFQPPVPMTASLYHPVGTGVYVDSGTGWRSGPLLNFDGNIRLFVVGGGYMVNVNATGDPFGWAQGDRIHLAFDYPTY
jgi:hypothetical protein